MVGAGLGGLYGELVVHLRVRCCVTNLRDDWSGTAEGGYLISFLLLAGGISPGVRHILAVTTPGIDVLSGEGD